jgi:bifunctional UDP-N-acetylglucosamine pyrophosphorylase/glucosamine-1-phosphate N-acetyltransferase
MTTTAIILAAGQGTRMKSSLPKVLHPIAGQSMILYAIQAAQAASDTPPVVVIGHGAEEVRQVVGDQARFVVQEQQLGTGHAVQVTESLLRGESDLVLVSYGDMPLLTATTFQRMVQAQKAHSGPLTILTVMADDPRGFGRVVRGPSGQVQGIVEEAQAAPDQLAIHELNAGVYCFSSSWLWDSLRRIPLSPKGEYYLPDLVAIAVQDGLFVNAITIEDPHELLGINTRVHLAEAEAAMRARINRAWMLAGVTIVDPLSTYIEAGVTIGQDTVIHPNTHLQGNTQIGEFCSIGPNSILKGTRVGNHCEVLASVLEFAQLDDYVGMGPFGRLRKGAHLADHVHLGNFGEVKNSYLGPGTKMGHFSYIGDAQIGENVNIGCGTITCNFGIDGKKNKTVVGDNVFIGSDTMLVAPVEVGEGAITGTGSVVTHDVPPKTLVVGVPARPLRKLE